MVWEQTAGQQTAQDVEPLDWYFEAGPERAAGTNTSCRQMVWKPAEALLDVPALWAVLEPLEALELSEAPAEQPARAWAVPALQDAEALEPALQAFRLPEASVEAADEAVLKPASCSLQREKE